MGYLIKSLYSRILAYKLRFNCFLFVSKVHKLEPANCEQLFQTGGIDTLLVNDL